MLCCRVSALKKPKRGRKADDINVTELILEDFAPVPRENIGKGLAKLANAPRTTKG